MPEKKVNMDASQLELLIGLVRSGSVQAPEVIAAPKSVKSQLLFIACHDSNLSTVRELIALGADANRRTGSQAPLFIAAGLGHVEIVRFLLVSGANPNITSASEESSRETPLMVATKHPEIIRLLLAAGADSKAIDGDGNSAMYPASTVGNRDVMAILLDAGCPVTGVCLHLPVYRRELDIVQRMLKHRPVLDVGFPWTSYVMKGELPLIIAVTKNVEDLKKPRSSRIGLIEALLNAGADPNVRDQFSGRNPLWIAVDEKDAEVARMLVKAGADPNEQVQIKTGRNTSALELARSRGMQDLVAAMQPTFETP